MPKYGSLIVLMFYPLSFHILRVINLGVAHYTPTTCPENLVISPSAQLVRWQWPGGEFGDSVGATLNVGPGAANTNWAVTPRSVRSRRFDSLLPMLRDGVRHCDVCDQEIPEGERYVVSKISKDFVRSGTSPSEAGVAIDSLGNARLDICLDCRVNMRVAGEERVN
jgi:hypothetical protein